MKIRMISTLAGPDACFDAGKVYECEEGQAKLLIAAGTAIATETAALKENLIVEVADVSTEFERRDLPTEKVEQAETKKRGRPRK